ncbi:hypothetical protein NDU88_001818 [Pleurodeles waltl]|uniref:Uncharacterized protein n=1 Tax=Pleurodeles waltl TaxID=8319 RepID=A0AAV7MKV3_PLEWA|nr:hypothetical protein NDU88_001818 [Pleurodeles waltl]
MVTRSCRRLRRLPEEDVEGQSRPVLAENTTRCSASDKAPVCAESATEELGPPAVSLRARHPQRGSNAGEQGTRHGAQPQGTCRGCPGPRGGPAAAILGPTFAGHRNIKAQG